MKAVTAMLGLVLAGAAAAATLQFPPHLAAGQFLKQWRGTGNAQTQRVIEEQVYAQGYLDAVVDLTQGREWCSPASMEPGERDDRVTTALGRQPSGPNAAKALLAQYVARFPCQ